MLAAGRFLVAGFNPGAEEYNDQREAGRLGFAPSPGPGILQTVASPTEGRSENQTASKEP